MNTLQLSQTRRGRTLLRRAHGLGWFSIGLGLAELLLPRRLAGATGLHGQTALLRACGLREIAVGAGLLLGTRPGPWLWARVGGDLLDAATLAARLDAAAPQRLRTLLALGAVAGVAAVDVAAARELQRCARAADAPVHDYSDRRGLPELPAQMRGRARDDFDMPADMRTPPALRPYALH